MTFPEDPTKQNQNGPTPIETSSSIDLSAGVQDLVDGVIAATGLSKDEAVAQVSQLLLVMGTALQAGEKIATVDQLVVANQPGGTIKILDIGPILPPSDSGIE